MPDAATGVFVPPADLRSAVPTGGAVARPTGSWLEVLRGGEPGDVIDLVGPTVAGRAADVDLLLADVSVSRRHARFRTEVGGEPVVVEDLGSLNGTYVNGSRVEVTELHDGDVIRIGRFLLRYRTGGEG